MSIMETTERRKPRVRRAFTPEFKAEIVELCQRGDRSIGQVARDFDLTETAVREWVRQAERDSGTRSDGGLTSAERQELAALRREKRQLREDLGVLKRATAFFAKETRGTCIRSSRRREHSSAASSARVRCWRSPVPPTTPIVLAPSRPAGAPTTPSQGTSELPTRRPRAATAPHASTRSCGEAATGTGASASPG